MNWSTDSTYSVSVTVQKSPASSLAISECGLIAGSRKCRVSVFSSEFQSSAFQVVEEIIDLTKDLLVK